VPQLETKTPRDANLAYAKNVIQACEHLKDLLTESAFSRDYSLESLASQSECNAIVNQVKKLQKTAEAAAVNNSSISRKIRRADPRRDEYLKILCDLWVNIIRGPKTTSYKRAGEASGPFVDFLYLTALPVLGQFTRNGAASFIKRWRNGMAV
jgi:hypothetical protein